MTGGGEEWNGLKTVGSQDALILSHVVELASVEVGDVSIHGVVVVDLDLVLLYDSEKVDSLLDFSFGVSRSAHRRIGSRNWRNWVLVRRRG